MPPVQVRENLGTIAMKGYSAFPKAPALLEPHQIVLHHNLDTRRRKICSEAVVYSIAPVDWASSFLLLFILLFVAITLNILLFYPVQIDFKKITLILY